MGKMITPCATPAQGGTFHIVAVGGFVKSTHYPHCGGGWITPPPILAPARLQPFTWGPSTNSRSDPPCPTEPTRLAEPASPLARPTYPGRTPTGPRRTPRPAVRRAG